MNAVEIEEAVSDLVNKNFDPVNFPFLFLEAFGNKSTTIKKLRSGASNKSDVGALLQRNNVHLAICSKNNLSETLQKLRESKNTTKFKVKFIIATDGRMFEAEDMHSGEMIVCEYKDLSNYFGFFLPLAGISTTKQIRENAFDIKATGRLNKLYVELIKNNPDWEKSTSREDINHFIARLIFCFFAEDTDIFGPQVSFTKIIEQMSERDASNTHEIISEIFKALNTPKDEHQEKRIAKWASVFPYVNGGLFSNNIKIPIFNKIARSYLIHIGNLDWKKINPDIFGSMIQAVAEDEERGFLGMHYTSVPNILKVLNPLFLNELNIQLENAENNERKLFNLRKRISKIRVFDPACGSGNFLVIAYKELRKIEDKINTKRREIGRKTEIPLTNFRGIEIRQFASEIARLALVIAEYQCNLLYLGQKEALAEFLPLASDNWITCGDALEIPWEKICPKKGNITKFFSDNLFETPLNQSEVDFKNEGGEIFICGNPPYKGRNKKDAKEKKQTKKVFEKYSGSFAALDFVANWFLIASEYCSSTNSSFAFVSTNSICQGEQVALLWPILFKNNLKISFAHTSFQWSNLATDKAGVTVVIVGMSNKVDEPLLINQSEIRAVNNIGPYLVANSSVIVKQRLKPLSNIDEMYLGNMAKDGGNLIFTIDHSRKLIQKYNVDKKFIKKFYGSEELIHGKPRACLWILDDEKERASQNPKILEIMGKVRNFRLQSKAPSTKKYASTPHKFVQISAKNGSKAIVIPRVSSHNRSYLPVDYLKSGPTIGDKCFAIYDSPIWNFSLLSSRIHLIWIATVCSRLRNDFSYGNKLGWNTFPVPKLTEKNKNDLTNTANKILLTRENYFPNSIAELYRADMPDDLKFAHDQNDKIIERIYIGRSFKNDSERLEKLFSLYEEMN